MGGYAARRLLLALPTLLGLSLLVFLLGSLAGDPSDELAARSDPEAGVTAEQVAAIRHDLGLDRPLPVRYGRWLGRAVRGDLGTSLFTNRGVGGQIADAFPTTLVLAVAALVLIVLLAVPMGVAGALFHRHWQDQAIRALALTGASAPGFFLAYVLVHVFAVRLRLLPVAGLSGARSVVLPAFTLAVGPAAMVSRLLRASLLEVVGEDYIRTARGKGLAAVPVLVNHAVRNAALPVLTVVGSVFGRMIEGAVVIEVVFSRPGIGQLTYNAVRSYDYPVVVGTVVFGGAMFMLVNLLVDLSYGLVDPRVRLGRAR
ncbi:MAG TPA: ABC transporter permease [Acidimicrobiales bacterium]|nr:ABC transporter permease [Acidimicrobiales bacterium]